MKLLGQQVAEIAAPVDITGICGVQLTRLEGLDQRSDLHLPAMSCGQCLCAINEGEGVLDAVVAVADDVRVHRSDTRGAGGLVLCC